MSNCLVTKLNGSVNNDLLPAVGCFIIHVTKQANPTQATQKFDFGPESSNKFSFKIEVIQKDKGYFAENYADTIDGGTVANRKTEWTTTLANRTIYFKNDDFDVIVTNKYNLSRLIFGASQSIERDAIEYSLSLRTLTYRSAVNDLSWLKGLSLLQDVALSSSTGNTSNLQNSIQNFSCLSCDIEGNVSDFKEMTSLQSIQITRELSSGNPDNFTGALDELGSIASLRSFDVRDYNVTFDVGSFVTKQIAAGNTTPNVVAVDGCVGITGFAGSTTFRGQSVGTELSNRLYWNGSSKIIFYSGTTGGNKNTATKVYAYGASAEEIAEWGDKYVEIS